MLTLPLLFLLGQAARNREAGLWAMFLATLSVYHAFYSRQSYPYSLVILLTAGTMWTGILLLKQVIEGRPYRWPLLFGYAAFTTLLLQAHLSSLLFLVPWTGLMGLAVLAWTRPVRTLFTGTRIAYWVIGCGAAFLAFSPFLVQLMAQGYTSTDIATNTIYFSWTIIPTLLGRMGWGEGLWALIPFTIVLVAGVAVAVRPFSRDGWRNPMRLVLLIAAAYFAVQSWTQVSTKTRLEVRYYSALYVPLVILAGAGLDWITAWVAGRLPRVKKGVIVAAIVAPVVLWSAVNLWNLCRLNVWGHNYKGIAAWINRNVPERGVYSFVQRLRAARRSGRVPDSRPHRDFRLRVEHVERLQAGAAAQADAVALHSLPTHRLHRDRAGRHPHAADRRRSPSARPRLRAPRVGAGRGVGPPAPVQDPADRRGPAERDQLDRVLYSYNKPEDMPALAARRGDNFYHYFGGEWQYVRDQQMNDWELNSSYATLLVGSVKDQPVNAWVDLQCVGVPSGCRVSVLGADGRTLAGPVDVPPALYTLSITNLALPSGRAVKLTVQVQPPPGQMQGALLVGDLRVREE